LIKDELGGGECSSSIDAGHLGLTARADRVDEITLLFLDSIAWCH